MIKTRWGGNIQKLMVEFGVSVAEIEGGGIELMPFESVSVGHSASTNPAQPLAFEGRETWMRRLVNEHFSFIWRNLKRLGIAAADVEDATQQVFIIAERRRADIAPGKERAFLYGVTLRIAQTRRRSAARSREDSRGHLAEMLDGRANPEDMVVQLHARALLDEVLEQLPLELRAVFTLCELDEQTVQQAADLLQIPAGTAASRLARARRQFTETVQRITNQSQRRGAP